jgi:hypothetical protein
VDVHTALKFVVRVHVCAGGGGCAIILCDSGHARPRVPCRRCVPGSEAPGGVAAVALPSAGAGPSCVCAEGGYAAIDITYAALVRLLLRTLCLRPLAVSRFCRCLCPLPVTTACLALVCTLATSFQRAWSRVHCPLLARQTAQLDGETNLKLRRAPDCIYERFESDERCLAFRGRVRCEEPTEHFGRFTAFIYPDAGSSESYPLNADNTLLRGCVLRNVEWVYGLVVYTGNQTKVRVAGGAFFALTVA